MQVFFRWAISGRGQGRQGGRAPVPLGQERPNSACDTLLLLLWYVLAWLVGCCPLPKNTQVGCIFWCSTLPHAFLLLCSVLCSAEGRGYFWEGMRL